MERAEKLKYAQKRLKKFQAKRAAFQVDGQEEIEPTNHPTQINNDVHLPKASSAFFSVNENPTTAHILSNEANLASSSTQRGHESSDTASQAERIVEESKNGQEGALVAEEVNSDSNHRNNQALCEDVVEAESANTTQTALPVLNQPDETTLIREKQMLESTVNQLHGDLQTEISEKQELQARWLAHESSETECSTRVQKLKALLDSERQKYSKEISDLGHEKAAFEKEAFGLLDQEQKIRAKIEREVAENVKDINAHLEKINGEKIELELDLQKLHVDCELKDQELELLNARIVTLEKSQIRTDQLQNENVALERQIENNETQVVELQTAWDRCQILEINYKKSITEKDKSIFQIAAQLEESKLELEAQTSRLQSENSGLAQNLVLTTEQLTILRARLQEAEDQHASSLKQLRETQGEERSDLQSKIKGLLNQGRENSKIELDALDERSSKLKQKEKELTAVAKLLEDKQREFEVASCSLKSREMQLLDQKRFLAEEEAILKQTEAEWLLQSTRLNESELKLRQDSDLLNQKSESIGKLAEQVEQKQQSINDPLGSIQKRERIIELRVGELDERESALKELDKILSRRKSLSVQVSLSENEREKRFAERENETSRRERNLDELDKKVAVEREKLVALLEKDTLNRVRMDEKENTLRLMETQLIERENILSNDERALHVERLKSQTSNAGVEMQDLAAKSTQLQFRGREEALRAAEADFQRREALLDFRQRNIQQKENSILENQTRFEQAENTILEAKRSLEERYSVKALDLERKEKSLLEMERAQKDGDNTIEILRASVARKEVELEEIVQAVKIGSRPSMDESRANQLAEENATLKEKAGQIVADNSRKTSKMFEVNKALHGKVKEAESVNQRLQENIIRLTESLVAESQERRGGDKGIGKHSILEDRLQVLLKENEKLNKVVNENTRELEKCRMYFERRDTNASNIVDKKRLWTGKEVGILNAMAKIELENARHIEHVVENKEGYDLLNVIVALTNTNQKLNHKVGEMQRKLSENQIGSPPFSLNYTSNELTTNDMLNGPSSTRFLTSHPQDSGSPVGRSVYGHRSMPQRRSGSHSDSDPISKDLLSKPLERMDSQEILREIKMRAEKAMRQMGQQSI